MSNAIFPNLAGLAWDVLKVPKFSTLIQRAASGREVRAAIMAYPDWEWTLTYDLLRDDAVNNELKTLMGFWLQRQGAFDSFLFTDPNDFSVTGQALGTGDGSNRNFQLIRTYGGFNESIYDLNGASVIKLNGTPTAAYTISGTGLIIFTTAPGAGVSVTGDFSFYRRVRFKEDTAEFANFMFKLWSLRQISLVSVKP